MIFAVIILVFIAFEAIIIIPDRIPIIRSIRKKAKK
jgi:hypothetical protein